MAETTLMTRAQRAMLVLLDSLIGAVVAPLNFIGGLSLIAANGGRHTFVPDQVFELAGRIFTPEGLRIAFPCFLSTLVLVPLLIRRLEGVADGPHAWKRAALYGFGFGVVATFVTCILALAVQCLSEPLASPVDLFVKLFGSVLFGMVGAPAFLFWCFPFLIVSGVLFGILNLGLVKGMARARRAGAN